MRKNYTSHKPPRGSYFRSCAVSGADWNPESGFTECVDVWKTGKHFIFNLCTICVHKHLPTRVTSPRPVVQQQWKVSRERFWRAFGIHAHWLQMSAASPFHPPCRLFFVTFALLKESECSPRSELKPGYSLKSTQITDSLRIEACCTLHLSACRRLPRRQLTVIRVVIVHVYCSDLLFTKRNMLLCLVLTYWP